MKRAILLFLAACAAVRSDRDVILRLQEEARRNPNPELRRVASRIKEPLDLPGGRAAFALPMSDGVLPSVRGRLDGVDGLFLVDTGASHVSLSAPLARRAGAYVPPGEPGSAIAPGHKTRVYPAAARDLEVGPLRIPVLSVVVREEQVYTRSLLSTKAIYDGVLGASLLSLFRVVFDFKEREVRFFPHDEPGRAEVMFAPVRINGRTYHLLVDSGAAGLYIEPWVALELGLLEDGDAERLGRGADSLAEIRTTRVDVRTLDVDERSFRDVRAIVIRTFGDLETGTGRRPAGLLGLAGFGELVWTIAYDRMALKVEG